MTLATEAVLSPSIAKGTNMGEEYLWYPVRTKPACEWQARVNLLRQGFRAFLPFTISNRPYGRRIEGVVRAWLPSYIFVGALKGKSIRPINSTIGVSTVLYRDSQPLVMTSAAMEDLRSRCHPSGQVIEPEPDNDEPKFRVGQKVRITSGPFADLVAEIARIDGNEAIRVWITLFGQDTEALVPVDGIAA